MLKKEIQQQLASIEQTANAYFNKAVEKEAEKASTWNQAGMPWRGHPDFGFDDLDPSDQELCSKMSQELANVVSQIFDIAEHSSRFDGSDQLALRDGIRFADAALRFRKYRRSSPYVEHEEDTILTSIPADQWEELTSISSARQEFREGMAAIGRILMRVPDGVHEEANDREKQVLSRKEFAEKIGRNPRTVKRYVDKGIIKANQNEAGRILNIPRSQLDSFLKKKD